MLKQFIMMLSLLSLFSTPILAETQDTYPFTTETQQAQFQRLTEQLRCLVCQNQSLADSHAPLAQDLRHKVADLIHQQLSDQQIVSFLVQRYGDFVLYQPPVNTHTYVLWFAPLLFVIAGLGVLIVFIIRQKHLRRDPVE